LIETGSVAQEKGEVGGDMKCPGPGCPSKVPDLTKGKPPPAYTPESGEVQVLFERGSVTLNPDGREELDLLISFLRGASSGFVDVAVFGYARSFEKLDSDPGYKRARAVTSYLVERGLRPEQIHISMELIAKGESLYFPRQCRDLNLNDRQQCLAQLVRVVDRGRSR
jgi:outer membrane protein OmpA-like peptidoglycan-associated protein